MWTVIEGLTGSGKTWLQTQLIRKEWLNGADAWVNYPVNFSDDNNGVFRWHALEEIFHLNKAIVGIDEAQELVGFWQSMPVSFRSKIAQHRKHFLDFYTTTQDFNNIHIQLRRNVHEIYRCESLARFPRKDRIKPLFQIIKVIRKVRAIKGNNEAIKFITVGWPKYYLISRLWTREYYNTYADIGFERFICKIKYELKPERKKKQGQWIMKIYSRDLVNQGKARL
jgi:hypothetical protein